MRGSIACLIVLCLCATPVSSGAWLRDKGTGFFSLSSRMTEDKQTSSSAFLEYGLSAGTTVGADVNMGFDGPYIDAAHGLLFLRKSAPMFGKFKSSYEIGVGTQIQNLMAVPAGRVKISIGRGFEAFGQNGWISMDAGNLWDLGNGTSVQKYSGTFGLSLGHRISGMAQLFHHSGNGNSITTQSASMIYKPQIGKASYVLGVERYSSARKSKGISFSVWRDF